jgi:uncharacterized caspase-like protein
MRGELAVVPMRLAGAVVALFWLALPAAAQEPLRGVALVIGQSEYEGLPALRNPENDANALDDLLGRLGFDVTRVLNADAEKLGRELEDFAEDAAGADVALVYYSGHGVEAGGENYLIPVDADLASDATELVPLSRVLEELSATVPVTIFLLDACRTSPFGDAPIQPPGAAVPVAAAAQGLAVPRGAVVTRHSADLETLGVVIGFAAWPGQAALDGEGENSPYAAALLKHLGAGGYEFGDLMTMVTQEVYRETETRQVPWVNASLQRFLYFGEPMEPRELLLSVEEAPAAARELVVALADQEDVPLDALFGMLNLLGVDTSTDGAELELQLIEGAERLRRIIADDIGELPDNPELVRLRELARQAENEGAISLALEFRAQASVEATALLASRVAMAEKLRADFITIAAVYGEHGETAALNQDYETAAEKFGQAATAVGEWDVELRRQYQERRAVALLQLNYFTDSATLPVNDPEAIRLKDAADQAARDGNIILARDLLTQANVRMAAIADSFDDLEAQIRQDRLEIAGVYANIAEDYEAASNSIKAAEAFQRASEEVIRWDEDLSALYRRKVLQALARSASLSVLPPAIYTAP